MAVRIGSQKGLIDLIPANIRIKIADACVVEAGFGAVPGFIVEKGKAFKLSSFRYGPVIVEFTTNETTLSPVYLLIYDDDPEFDGQPDISSGSQPLVPDATAEPSWIPFSAGTVGAGMHVQAMVTETEIY